MTETLIPDPPLVGLPGPHALLQILLFITFTLHLIPMNLVLGGSVIGAVSYWRGRSQPQARKLAVTLFKLLPVSIALTITLGVAPLLFIQTLYGQLFYTSSILTAWPWLSLLLFMLIGYAGTYMISMKGETLGNANLYLSMIVALMMLFVGSVFTSNLTLMQTPQRYQEVYAHSPLGLYLNFSDPTMVPRLLHFFLAALAMTGAFIGIAFKEFKLLGIRWFAAASFLQLAVGSWFLLSIQSTDLTDISGASLFSGNYFKVTLVIVGAMLASLIAAMLNLRRDIAFKLASILLVITIFLMSGVRSQLRESQLAPYFQLDPNIATQWGPFIVFVLVLFGGMAAVIWLGLVYRRAYQRQKNSGRS